MGSIQRFLTLVRGGGFQRHQTSVPPDLTTPTLSVPPHPLLSTCCLSTFSWSKEGLRVLRVEAQTSVGLEEAHLLSACCVHLGGHGQGTAEVGARPAVAAMDPGLKQAPSMKSWSEGSLRWRESWGMWRRCV